MNKYNALKKRYENADKAQAKILAELAALEQRQAALQAEADNAAAAGSMAAFTRAKEESRRIDDEREFTEAQLEKAKHPATEAEILAAWKSYTDTDGEQLRSAWQSYTQARRALARQFIAIMNRQEEIQTERKALAKLTGIDKKQLKCYLIDISEVYADREFFARTGEVTTEQNLHYGGVLANKHFGR